MFMGGNVDTIKKPSPKSQVGGIINFQMGGLWHRFTRINANHPQRVPSGYLT